MKLTRGPLPLLLAVGLLWARAGLATTWTCPTGAWAEVDSNIVSRVVDGDIVALPAGTNHWVTAITNTPTPKQFTIQGVGTHVIVVPGASVPATNTLAAGSTVTAVVCDHASGSIVNMGSISNAAQGFRVTGIAFMRGTNTPPDQSQGLISMRGTNKRFRIDHCEFWTVGQSDIYVHDWALGCIDHNVFWDQGNNLSVVVDHPGWGDHDNGHGSWSDNNSLGTTNAVYIEWNIATNQYSTSGILDGDLGGRAVVRYNTMSNLPPVTTHGTDTGLRSFRQLEYYGNWAYWDTNQAAGGNQNLAWGRMLYSRGGTVIAYSNSSLGYGSFCTLSVYRDFMGQWNVWAGASGTNVWDTNSPSVYYSGTHNGATGPTFIDTNATWISGQWSTGFVVLNLTRKTYGVISANDGTGLGSSFASGAQSGVGGGWGETNILFVAGDACEIRYLDHAIDQAGLGKGELLSGNPPLNTVQGNIPKWPNEISEKCYEWSNVTALTAFQIGWLGHGPNGLFSAQMPNIKTNADWIDGLPMPGYTQLGQNPLDPISEPAITVQPANQTVAVGNTATFTVTAATASPPLTYQWSKNGSQIGGATLSTYTTPATVCGDNGASFTVLVSNSTNATASSSAATLTVTGCGAVVATINAAVVNAGILSGPLPALTNLVGAVLYVDINARTTNQSGAAPGNLDAVKGWGDLSQNATNSLVMLGGASVCPTNHSTGGPTNGPWLEFGIISALASVTGQMLTNTIGGATLAQPNTYFFVVKDVWPSVNGGGCVLNGYGNQSVQWNYSVGAENFYAGVNASFLTAGTQAGWPASPTWGIVTLQFNGASSIVRVNGHPWPIASPAIFNTGANGATGITLGNYFNGTVSGIFGITALIWVNGTYWLNAGNLLQVEEELGQEFGITVP